jgi:hypothetical protein
MIRCHGVVNRIPGRRAVNVVHFVFWHFRAATLLIRAFLSCHSHASSTLCVPLFCCSIVHPSSSTHSDAAPAPAPADSSLFSEPRSRSTRLLLSPHVRVSEKCQPCPYLWRATNISFLCADITNLLFAPAAIINIIINPLILDKPHLFLHCGGRLDSIHYFFSGRAFTRRALCRRCTLSPPCCPFSRATSSFRTRPTWPSTNR